MNSRNPVFSLATAKPSRARSRAWIDFPIRYIRIKMAKIRRMEQKGLKKIKEIQVKEFA